MKKKEEPIMSIIPGNFYLSLSLTLSDCKVSTCRIALSALENAFLTCRCFQHKFLASLEKRHASPHYMRTDPTVPT